MTTVVDSQKSKWSKEEADEWIRSELVAYRNWYYWQVRWYRFIQTVIVIGTGVSTFAATVTAAALATRWIPTACAAFATLLIGLSSGLGLNNAVRVLMPADLYSGKGDSILATLSHLR